MLCVVLWRSNLGLWQEAWFATGFLTRYLIVLPQRNAFVVSLGKGLGLSHCFRTGFAFVLYEHSMNILNYSHRCHHISVISVISVISIHFYSFLLWEGWIWRAPLPVLLLGDIWRQGFVLHLLIWFWLWVSRLWQVSIWMSSSWFSL